MTNSSTSAGGQPEARGLHLDAAAARTPGTTSTGVSRSCAAPKNIIAAATKTTRNRNFRLEETIQRIVTRAVPRSAGPQWSMLDLELGTEQLGRADRHDLGTRRWTLGQQTRSLVDALDLDLRPDEARGFGLV